MMFLNFDSVRSSFWLLSSVCICESRMLMAFTVQTARSNKKVVLLNPRLECYSYYYKMKSIHQVEIFLFQSV